MIKFEDLSPAVTRPANPPVNPPVNPQGAAPLSEADAARLAAGQQWLAKRQPGKAIEQLEGLSPSTANNPHVIRLYGLAYARRSDYALAEKYLARSAATKPDDLEVQLALARVRAAAGQPEAAILSLRTAMLTTSAGPDNPLAARALLYLSDLLGREGYLTASLDCLTELSGRINTHRRQLLADPAIAALVLRPERLLVARGELLSKLGRYPAAAEVLATALRYDRSQRNAARLLVGALVSSGQFGRAERFIVDIAGEPSQRPGLGELAETVCLKSGDDTTPGRLADRLAADKHLDGDLAVALATAAVKLSQPNQALRILRIVSRSEPANPAVAGMLAGLLADSGRHRQALLNLSRIICQAPRAAEAIRAVTEGIEAIVATETPADIESTFALSITRGDLPDDIAPFAAFYVAGRLAAAYDDQSLAAELYRRTIADNENFTPAYEVLAEYYASRGRATRLRRLLDHVESVAPDSGFPAYLRGRILLESGKYSQAVEQFRAARKKSPDDVQTLLLLGKTLAGMGRSDEAQAVGLAATRADPDNEQAYRLLFDTYMSRRQYGKAAGVVSRLARQLPGNPVRYVLAGRLALRTGRLEIARSALARLQAEQPGTAAAAVLGAQIDMAAGNGHLAEADFMRTADRLGEVLLRDPTNQSARRTLARLFARQGEPGRAYGLKTWRRIYRQGRRNREIARSYAAALSQAGQLEQSAKVLDELLVDDPRDLASRSELLQALAKLPDHRRVVAQCLAGQKLLDQWIDSLRQAGPGPAGTDSARIEALRRTKLTFYLQAGMYDRYMAYLARRLAQPGDSRELRLLAVGQLVKAGKPELVHRLLDEWIAAGGPDADAYRRAKLGLYVQFKKYRQASRFALAWSADQPGRALPRIDGITQLAAAGQYDLAQELADYWVDHPLAAATTQPATTRPATTRPLATRPLATKPLETRPLETRPLETRPARPTSRPIATSPRMDPAQANRQIRIWAVRLLLQRYKLHDALRRADRYITLDATNPSLLTLKSSILTELGRDGAAAAAMEAAYRLGPDDPSVNNNLGYLYAQAGIKLDQAERMIRLAISDRPAETAFRDSLGWVFYKQGKFGQAGRIFTQLVAEIANTDRSDATIYDHAGDVMWRLGKKDQAVKLWRSAVRLAKRNNSKFLEYRQALCGATGKLEAVKAGTQPRLAPLGRSGDRPGNNGK